MLLRQQERVNGNDRVIVYHLFNTFVSPRRPYFSIFDPPNQAYVTRNHSNP